MLQKILVTLDGSALSWTALPQVVQFVSANDTAVAIIEVADTIEQVRREAEGQSEFTDGDAARIEQLAQQMHFNRRHRALDDVERAEAELRKAGLTLVTASVVEGLPGNEIVNLAAREGYDAIVMATRGHGGLGREVVGSVAEYVLRHAGDAAVVLVGPRSATRDPL